MTLPDDHHYHNQYHLHHYQRNSSHIRNPTTKAYSIIIITITFTSSLPMTTTTFTANVPSHHKKLSITATVNTTLIGFVIHAFTSTISPTTTIDITATTTFAITSKIAYYCLHPWSEYSIHLQNHHPHPHHCSFIYKGETIKTTEHCTAPSYEFKSPPPNTQVRTPSAEAQRRLDVNGNEN